MSSSPSKRPGPLQELPLARFMPLEPKCVANPFKSTPKRPRSPGTPVGLLSPTKKRILREEKMFVHPEPTKAPTRGSLLDHRSGMHSTTTPSRKLDFGSPSASSSGNPTHEECSDRVTRQTRRSSIPNRRLAPSPDLVKSRSVQRATPSHYETRDTETKAQEEPSCSTIPFMIPREIPDISDRQSIHYPGFDIHIDTHMELLSTRRRPQTDMSLQTDLDSTKENVAPKRKAKKTITAPSELQVVMGKAVGVDGSSRASSASNIHHHTVDKTPGRTPRQSHYTRQVPATLTPGRTPVPTKSAQIQRRRALEEEVDVPDDETSEEMSDA